jgi:hypothetical protein
MSEKSGSHFLTDFRKIASAFSEAARASSAARCAEAAEAAEFSSAARALSWALRISPSSSVRRADSSCFVT